MISYVLKFVETGLTRSIFNKNGDSVNCKAARKSCLFSSQRCSHFPMADIHHTFLCMLLSPITLLDYSLMYINI